MQWMQWWACCSLWLTWGAKGKRTQVRCVLRSLCWDPKVGTAREEESNSEEEREVKVIDDTLRSDL